MAISLGRALLHASVRRNSVGRAVRSLRSNRAVLLQVGFTRARVSAGLRELLPPDFTLAWRLAPSGMFLWHFPSSCPDRTLSCTLPYEARTFLTRSNRARPSGALREVCGGKETRKRRGPAPRGHYGAPRWFSLRRVAAKGHPWTRRFALDGNRMATERA